jgi:hypothetical protein
MVLQLAVRDIGQLTDLAVEPDEPLAWRMTGRHAPVAVAETTDRSEKRVLRVGRSGGGALPGP